MKALQYTKQGHIPHLLQPEIVGKKLIALEQFITNPIPIPSSILHTTDLNRKKLVKSVGKGLGLQHNGNNFVCSPQMVKDAISIMKPELLIVSDVQQEMLEYKYNTKTLNQEQKHHKRFFKFVEGLLGLDMVVCVCGTSIESITKSSLDFKRLDDSIHGYGIILPTPFEMTKDVKREISSLLDAFVQNTPKEKPKIVLGVANFEILYECFKRGIETIDDSFLERAVEHGLALTLVKSTSGYSTRIDDFSKENLKWKSDFKGIEESCGCWTCKRHTRAYIHHLFVVNDMLSYVMLMYHNQFQLNLFLNLLSDESCTS